MLQKKVEAVDGETAVMMVMGGIEDTDDEALAKALAAVLGCEVKVIGDDQFEITWEGE